MKASDVKKPSPPSNVGIGPLRKRAGGGGGRQLGRALAPVLSACLVASFAPAPVRADAQAVEGMLLDRVVAVIAPVDSKGQRILITLSDLEIEARLVLIGRGGLRAAEEMLSPDVLASTLDWLISEHLLLGEAEQLSLAAVEPADVTRSLEELEEQLGSLEYQRFLQRQELSEGDLLRVMRRRVVVDRYLSSRLRLGAVVSEAEIRRAFDARKEELGLEDFAAAREGLKAQLERQRREEVVSALVSDLRSRAQVRVLHSFGIRGQGREPAPADPASSNAPRLEERLP